MIVRGILLAVLGAVSLAACGSARHLALSEPASPPRPFPAARGETVTKLTTGLRDGPMLAPTVTDLQPGLDRFGFGLFDESQRAIRGASVALYVERAGGGSLSGPFPAREESMTVPAPYRSKTVSDDRDAPDTLYVARLRFPTAGVYAVQAIARIGGRLVRATPIAARVSAHDAVPAVGSRAPRVPTPTAASVRGDLAAIDTRVPPDDMHQVSLANVLGKKPVLLLFATPALCQSRVCGPVTDTAEEVHSQHPRAAAFIHSEIYLDNTIHPGCLEGKRPPDQCLRPQVRAYHLPTEPWLFAIDRHGTIVDRIEGAFAKPELEAALHDAVSR